jgi:hypothetical protein
MKSEVIGKMPNCRDTRYTVGALLISGLNLIADKTALGQGSNRLEIIPIRGETSERQMMVYFPEHHLLYGSDPFQKLPDGSYFYPQTVTELQDAVVREHLTPERFFMMHVGPTPWTDLQKAVKAAEAKNTPDGSLLGKLDSWRP